MEPVISLKNVLVTQGEGFSLLIDSLDLFPRRIYTLTGPNGAGKSTLLKTMALLIVPQSGVVTLNKVDPDCLTQQRQKVTFVEQSPYMLAHTVSDNLAFGLKLRGIRGKEQQSHIRSALTVVGLDGFETRNANELSAGEMQRVALARALVLEPKVLLLDEPTSSIDNKSLQDFEALIRSLPEHGVTVVVATHDLLLAERLKGEMLRIENGTLIDGTHQTNHNSTREKRAWLKPLNAQGL